jgi:hypothetical protein
MTAMDLGKLLALDMHVDIRDEVRPLIMKQNAARILRPGTEHADA